MERKIENILKVLQEKGEWSGALTDEELHTITRAVYKKNPTPSCNYKDCKCIYVGHTKGRKVRNKEEWNYTIKIEVSMGCNCFPL